MLPTEENATTPSNARAWLLIALGGLAVAVGLWDVLVERDGSTGGSIAALAVGLMVLAMGLQRRRKE